ncbi:phage baseplate assembly protein V [Kitasatospora azatica]|uniref:phage baseplate assembly protein V n=1 Tax=Kitasatospora azatica TaxID=58347 RepID=UPI000567C739|nr:phage baseplate assembly protein V [Kitasatospora azatica]
MTVTETFYAPRFELRIAGLTMAADLTEQALSLTVETDLDLAGSFHLVLRNADNTLLDSPLLDLGKTVEIHLGYGDRLTPAFLGEIAAIEPSFPQDGPPTVAVSGYDKSYRMRRAQTEAAQYTLVNDSLIAAELAALNGLIPVVDPTPGFPAKTIKVENDFAFLKSRAQQYFFDVYVEWDRLHFEFPRPQLAARVLEWGHNLSSFAPRISSAGLAGLQVVRGYNQELAQTIHGAALAADFDLDNLVERLGSGAMELLGTLVREGVRTEPVENPLDALVLAKSLLGNLLEGLYEGTGSCIGLPDLSAGRYVRIQGVGKRFSGTYRLRKVTHRIDGSGFTTEFSITQRSHSSLLGMLRKQLVEEPAPNEAQRFYGVVLAEVTDNNELLDMPPQLPLGRVKVRYPGLSDKFTSGWAPCARPMAGDGMGFYALPERGDQVLVAFEHGDLSKPYVLGGLWTAQQPPPTTNTDNTNSRRVIRSRAGHTITFDDTADLGALVIEDKLGSTISLDATDGSITISAKGDLTISAGRTLSLEAAGGLTKITMDATKVDVT